jgi:hypothetical protein
MKLCRTCNTEKDCSLFGKRVASIDGLCAKCKVCQSKYDKSRSKNPDRVLARNNYAKTEAGIEALSRGKKKWAAKNKGKIYETTKSYRERYPNKYRAHGKVAYAIKMGDLTAKPCEICGKINTHGHHDDYSKALDVRWLCPKHHNEWHKENGEGKNA